MLTVAEGWTTSQWPVPQPQPQPQPASLHISSPSGHGCYAWATGKDLWGDSSAFFVVLAARWGLKAPPFPAAVPSPLLTPLGDPSRHTPGLSTHLRI